eukprot:CAMPEP_0118850862 /NCGR_PEP_ID=MMETSP1163-20130328/524_1 /TAXON_ID=124430 /ORGANISM="Phaeomonas parva, Strain CCMP2877" /LENGTH=507 /DNA_ID=CAMNT_0006783105 /DNA_START=222 /DNA_END=1745 /DNA_ORIENTATION=+
MIFLAAISDAASYGLASLMNISEWGTSMQVAVGVAAFMLLVNAYMVTKFLLHCWKMRDYAGPLPLPLVGNLLDPLFIRSLIVFISTMRKRYGKMFVIWPGNSPLLVVMEPKNVRQILSDTKRFPKGKRYTEFFGTGFGQGLVTSTHEKHKKDRACLGKYFIKGNLQQYMGKVAEFTGEAVQKYFEPNVGKEINLTEMYAMLTIRCFCQIALSRDMWKDWDDCKRFSEYVSEGSTIMGEHMAYGHPMWRIFPRTRKMLDEMIPFVRGVVARYITDRRQMMEDRPDEVPNDMFNGLLADLKADDKDASDQLISTLSAGHDTTSFFCCYVSYILAQRQDIQDKLKGEIRNVLKGRSVLTSEDFDNLKYMNMVFQETLRHFTVIPFLVRTAAEDVTMKETGDVIPAGTQLLITLSHMNRDPETWEKPNEFIPERFEHINGSSAKLGFLPFGYGSRTCVGNVLSMMEAKTIIANVLQHYRFKEAPGFKLRILAGISLVAEGVNVCIEREEMH